MKHPLVSLLIPAFNQQDYIHDAVSSALAQTYPNLEIIVHNDASTDNTANVLASLPQDKRLRIITTRKNHGMVPGWNFIMKKARGEYIKFLSSDDLLEPTCVAELVRAAKQHPQASLITCKRKVIDEKGRRIRTFQFSSKTVLQGGKRHARWILTTIRKNRIGEPSATLFKRKDIKRAGYFDPTFHNFVDFEYWLRLLAHGDLVYLNKTLCSFRTHGDTSTARAVQEGYFIDDTFNLIRKYYDSAKWREIFNLTEKDRKRVESERIRDILKNTKELLKKGRVGQATKYLRRLHHHIPLSRIVYEGLAHLLGFNSGKKRKNSEIEDLYS